ncbi:hypothetical protein HOU02_gp165 [Caulobacter phage CcrBL9]|uniref:Uncharacterized protein n=1 Tax=Caulobacter phage CcrBL9 TaxID=2283270 RepID=A0A385ED24_9CAUD|nr:hypothetical protein HOU02_gp020 [Caulobacter phage CcrBL9]YP_009810190.1 hypothetical protein HOU02_gp165 [Caulobacter phage CcrBL9]AXQ69044.1 hypothetical protein CcrBL9_gp020 [Caulobacter phage CcrBL9]AXQ69560.1 hypothetical protein CcrBL9_gp536 [Caulobacter phage CcrBL9]
MTAAASLFEQAQIEAAQAAIDLNTAKVGLETEDSSPGTDLFHLLGSLLTWADAWGVDFDDILSQVREPVNVTTTLTRNDPATYGQDQRFAAILANLDQRNTPSVPVLTRDEAETEAMRDLAAVVGKVIKVHDITGYFGETGQEDLRPHEGAPAFSVIVLPSERGDVIHWNDEHLDVRWNVTPAPGETRLYELRSLWVFGRGYVVEKEG